MRRFKNSFVTIWQKRSSRSVLSLAIIIVFASAGAALLLSSHAATPTASLEAEGGVVGSAASIKSDSTASGSSAVKLGSGGGSGSCPVSTPNVAGGPDFWGGCFPGAGNTGIPAGTTLTNYSGSCTITIDNTTIDAKTIDCSSTDLLIRASNVTITRSKVIGHIVIDTDTNQSWSLNLTDSEVAATAGDLPAIYSGNVNILRTNIYGGHNGLECQEHSSHCSLRDSWIHDQWQAPTGDTHLGGLALFGDAVPCTGTGSNGMTAVCLDVEHSSVVCDAPVNVNGGGCTGDINMIAHYGPITGAFISKNLMSANIGAAYCTYGGQAPENGATRVVYQDNVFKRGTNNLCASYGPVNAFKFTNTGNVWTSNKYEDGTLIVCTAADECL